MLVCRYENRTRCAVAQFRLTKLAVLGLRPSRFSVWRAFDLASAISDTINPMPISPFCRRLPGAINYIPPHRDLSSWDTYFWTKHVRA